MLIDHVNRVVIKARSAFGNTPLAVKVAGVHWWYGYNSHPAEATAGYYNTNGNSAYDDFEDLFSSLGVTFDFTCLEMTDAQ